MGEATSARNEVGVRPWTERAAHVLRMAAEPKRLTILELVREAPRNVGEICNALGVAQPRASNHLRLLRLTGLVASRRDGKRVVYSVADGNEDVVGAILALRELV